MVKLVYPNVGITHRSGAESLRMLFQWVASYSEKSPDAKPILAGQINAFLSMIGTNSTLIAFPVVTNLAYRSAVEWLRTELRMIALQARRSPEFAAVITSQIAPLMTFLGGVARLRIAANRGEQHAFISGNLTASNHKHICRTRHYIGNAATSNLVFLDNNWYLPDVNGSQDVIETDNNNPYIMQRGVEYNGVCVPVRWGGSLSVTVNPGALVQSDPLLPSEFGVTSFPAGAEFFIRTERLVSIGGNSVWYRNTANSPAISGERAMGAGEATASIVHNTGALVDGGGWTAMGVLFMPCAILGLTAAGNKGFVTVGASIEAGANDNAGGDGVNGNGGYIRRAIANRYGNINLMKGGESARSFVNNSAKRRQLLQYGDVMLCGHGGNDYSYGYPVPITQERFRTIWAYGKAAGMRVHQISLSPKTNSTDSWATVANQTPRSGFDVGGAWRDAMHTYIQAQVPTLIDGFINMGGSQEDTAARDKWRVDLGTPTTDGTHPSAALHGAMATDLQGRLATL